MTGQLPDVWATRDLPVLREVARRIDAGEKGPSVNGVAEALGVDAKEVQLAAAALKRRGLVDTEERLSGVAGFTQISGDAYFLTGLHPSGDDAVSNLVHLLRQAAEQVDDPEEKTRLRKLADAAGGVSRTVLSGVLTTVITGQIN